MSEKTAKSNPLTGNDDLNPPLTFAAMSFDELFSKWLQLQLKMISIMGNSIGDERQWEIDEITDLQCELSAHLAGRRSTSLNDVYIKLSVWRQWIQEVETDSEHSEPADWLGLSVYADIESMCALQAVESSSSSSQTIVQPSPTKK